MKKLISVSLPCRNEEENILPLVSEIEKQFAENLPEYDYQIQFSDNCSTDKTREILRKLCIENTHVRAIFNVASFSGSAFHSILQTDGDCCIHMASDFQDPPELIPQLVQQWEQGSKVVCAIKSKSEENRLIWWFRTLYYKIMIGFSDIAQIEHFTGFGLYDRDFIEAIRGLSDPSPSLRGLVAEYGYKISSVQFAQPKRKHGRSSNNFYRLFDYAMRNFTTYTKVGIHAATIAGAAISGLLLIVALIYLILKLTNWYGFAAGMAPLVILVSFVGSMQLLLTGLVGEYVMSINTRVINKPYAIEEERIGFWGDSEKKPDHIPMGWVYTQNKE